MEQSTIYTLLKAFHIIFMVTWFSGLFYLPRLFVYHADTQDELGYNRFVIMERKLYYYITYPGGILTTILGCAMLYLQPNLLTELWMQIKIICVLILWLFHIACGTCLKSFMNNNNTKSHVFYRFFNEIPSVILITVILVAKLKPGISI